MEKVIIRIAKCCVISDIAAIYLFVNGEELKINIGSDGEHHIYVCLYEYKETVKYNERTIKSLTAGFCEKKLHKLAYRVEFADYDCEKNKKTLVFESYNPPADLEIYYAKSDIYSETESVGVYIFLNENAFRKAKSDLDEDSFWWYQKEK